MDILSFLNTEQQEAVTYCSGPQLIIAGPGSGKTRVLTHKIAYLILEKNLLPSQILAVTFTNKASLEIKERVAKLLPGTNLTGFWMGTFHSICSRILRTHGNKIGISPNFSIYDDSDSKDIIKQIEKELKIDPQKLNPGAVLSSISSAKSELVDPNAFSKYALGPFLQNVAKIYPLYEKALEKQNALDFDDLILKTVNLFKSNASTLSYFQNLFSYILVDEYQDTNHAQYELVKILAQKENPRICVVGDISQSIYSFRGADFRNVLLFEKDFHAPKVFHLAKNYRSTKTIVEASKNLIANNQSHIKINLETDNEKGEKIVLFEARNEEDEALYIVDTINNTLQKGYTLNDFAILYRTNAQSRSIEEALIKEGISYRLIGGTRFYDRKEIKDALSFLKILNNPKDTVSFERIINVPPRKIGEKSLDLISQNNFDLEYIEKNTSFPVTEIFNCKNKKTVLEILDAVLETVGYLKYLDDGTEESQSRIENLKELRSVASKFESLPDFLENVSLVNPIDIATDNNKKIAKQESEAVSLMTLHQAKGLEFPVVFLVGLEEGLFPHSRSLESNNDIEEERRLCYVGITRAKSLLILTYARQRLFFGTTSFGVVSRFVLEIPTQLIEATNMQNPATSKNTKPSNFKKSLGDFLDFLEEERASFD